MGRAKPFEVVPRDKYWVCACVKRKRNGQLSHIKANHPSITKCGKCGTTKEQHDRIAADGGGGVDG